MEWGERTDGKEEGERRRGERSLTIEITAKAPRVPPGASQSKSPEGDGNGFAHGSRDERGSKSGIEVAAVEKSKKMAKEVESGGIETKENERSTKKC